MKTKESNNIVTIYQLVPNDSHKSFYGKALIKELANGDKVLQSYDADICVKSKTVLLFAFGMAGAQQLADTLLHFAC